MKRVSIKKSWQDIKAQSFKRVFFKSSISGQKCHCRSKRDKNAKLFAFQGDSDNIQAKLRGFFKSPKKRYVVYEREAVSSFQIQSPFNYTKFRPVFALKINANSQSFSNLVTEHASVLQQNHTGTFHLAWVLLCIHSLSGGVQSSTVSGPLLTFPNCSRCLSPVIKANWASVRDSTETCCPQMVLSLLSEAGTMLRDRFLLL